jgi:hypothetical protein
VTGDKSKPFEIVVVGHSVGGMVARTAVVLDNHPACVIRNMVLLSAPIHRPPYSMDASNDAVYAAVNKAWKNSFFNESRECRLSMHSFNQRLRNQRSHLDFQDETGAGLAEITADWKCPVCARNIRILSLTGGIVDKEVFPDYTHLDPIAPRPVNVSTMRVKAIVATEEGMMWRFMRAFCAAPMNIIKFPFRLGKQVTGFLFPSLNLGVSDVVAPNVTNGTVIDEANVTTGADVSNTCAADACRNTDLATTVVNSMSFNTSKKTFNYSTLELHFHGVSDEQWRADMLSFVEPQHFSVRTTQLVDVKFPVDHLAILWCHQVIGAVSKAIRVMVKSTNKPFIDYNFVVDVDKPLPSASSLHQSEEMRILNITNFNSTARYKYLKKCYKKSYSRAEKVYSEMISPIAHYMERNDSLLRWREAETAEYEYVKEKLSVSSFGAHFAPLAGAINTLAFRFTTFQMANILLAYVITSCLICAASTLRALLGMDMSSVSCWTQCQPTYHFALDILVPALKRGVTNANSIVLPASLARKAASLLVWGPAGAILGYLTYQLIYHPTGFAQHSGTLLFLPANYGLALTLRIAVLCVIVVIRFIYNAAVNISSTILRCTIWCKPVRRNIRGLVGSIVGQTSSLLRYKDAPTYKATTVFVGRRWPTYISALLSVIVLYNSGSRIFGTNNSIYLGIGNFTWCALLVVLFVLITLSLSALIIFPGISSSTEEKLPAKLISAAQERSKELVLMYWIVVPLCLPSVQFALSLLFNDAKAIQKLSTVISMFGPDRIVLDFALLAVCYHLLSGRYAR